MVTIRGTQMVAILLLQSHTEIVYFPCYVLTGKSYQSNMHVQGSEFSLSQLTAVFLQGETWLARHAHVLQVVGAARSGGDMAKALLFVERMLCEQDMMQPHWGDCFQPAWCKGLAKCTESRQVIMYLAALQVQHSRWPHMTCAFCSRVDCCMSIHPCCLCQYTT